MRQKIIYFLTILVSYLAISLFVQGVLSFVFMLFPVQPYVSLIINLIFVLIINPIVAYIIGELLVSHKYI